MRGYVSSFSRSYLRKRAMHLMEDSGDECTITRPGPVKVEVDPVTNVARRVVGDVTVYDGACRLLKPSGSGKGVEQDQDVTIGRASLALPFDAPVPRMNDVVLLTGSDDPTLVDSKWTVSDVDQGGGLRGSRIVTIETFENEEMDS